jgi:hypothetical protein
MAKHKILVPGYPEHNIECDLVVVTQHGGTLFIKGITNYSDWEIADDDEYSIVARLMGGTLVLSEEDDG